MFPTVLSIVVLASGIAALFWFILRFSAAKIAAQYALLADKLGLELTQPEPVMGGFVRPEPSLYGKHAGRELSISAPGKGLQGTRQMETVLKMELRNKNFAAQLTRAGLLGGIRQRDSKGMARWKSDHDSFDSAVDVRTNAPDLWERILSRELREALMKLLQAGKGNIYIGGGVIAYAELGLIADAVCRARFESVVEHLLELAESIESHSLQSP